MSRTRKAILFLTISLLVTALASLADAWIARTVTEAGIPIQLKTWHLIAGRHVSIAEVLKFPGQYEATGIAAVLAILLCRKSPRWHAGVFVAVCALFSATNGLVKWMVGRARPFRELGDGPAIAQLHPFHFAPFVNGLHGISTSNLCFPSGHAALAMATAAGLAILFPRRRWAFYTIAAITSAERFLETAHWFSDTVAAAALGIGGAYLIYWLLESHLFAEQSTRELTAEQTS